MNILRELRVLRGKTSCLFTGSTLVIAFAITACLDRARDAPRSRLVERAGVAMGSELHFTAWTLDEEAARSAFDAAFREFDRLETVIKGWGLRCACPRRKGAVRS